MDGMKELKKLLIDHLYDMLADDRKAMKEMEKEFSLSEEQMERLVKKFLDKWLQSPDLIVMLSDVFGIYPAGGEEEEKGHRYYIG